MRTARIARKSQARAVDAELRAVVVHVLGNRRDFLNSRGELSLGGQAVIDRSNGNADLFSQHAADTIMRLEIAQHEPAAVRVDDCRRKSALCNQLGSRRDRVVIAHRDRTVRPVDLLIDGFGHDGTALDPVLTTGDVI